MYVHISQDDTVLDVHWDAAELDFTFHLPTARQPNHETSKADRLNKIKSEYLSGKLVSEVNCNLNN